MLWIWMFHNVPLMWWFSVFKQPRETELDEVVLLADQMYRTNLTPLARKRMCLITEVKLSPERIAKVVQRYYSKVPKDKKITWILCLGIYNFVEREHNRVCLTRQCKKKLIGIIDEDSKGSLYQKIHSALSTIKNFKSALEKALPKKATLVVAPPLPSALLGTDTFKGNHTQSHIIAMRYRLCLCSPLTYCFIRRFYMQMFDLWVNTVMKLEGGTCAELMSRYITEYKDKSLRLVDASHSNNYVKRCGKEWNNMMRNVISSTLTSTSFITGLSGLQRSVYLSRLSNVILLESSKNRGQTLTYSLQDKPDKTDYSFKQVVVVGNQMPAELDELCHRLSIHVVPHRVTFDEAGKTLITKYENLWPHNTLWVILTDVLHLIAAKPLPACEAVKCKDPIPVFGIEMPSNKNATNLQSYIKVKVDVFISKVKIFFDSLIDKLGEESAVFLPPVTPVFLMRPDLQESHQTLHAMYDSFGKIAMVNGKPKKWRSSYSLLKKAWLEMLEPYLEHYSVPKRILQLYSTSNSNQDWIKTLGELLVHFATTTNIGESDAVFSDAEFSSGEEDMMEVTEAMVATTTAAATAAAAAAAAAAASSSSSSSSSSVTLASVPTCSFQAMSTPPAQTQAAAGQGMQHEPERIPRQQQQNKGAVMWSGAQKQWHVVKEKEQLPHKTKRDHTTPMIEERQEKKTGEDEDLQGNKKGQKTPRKKKVLPTMEKRQWHDETDKSLQPPRKKICQETAKPEKGQQPPRIEKDQEVCRIKKGKASAKQGKVQEIAKQGRNMKASRGRKHVRASRQKEGQQSSKQGQETSKQRICQETSEPRKNKKEEGQEILIQGKCHVITKTEKDKETPMDGKDRETSTGGNYQVNIKKVHKSPIPIKDQVTIKTEKCPEIRGLEESEQLQMTKKDQVIVKMEEDQSIVKMEQFQDVIKSEEFEDMGRSEEVLWSVRKVEGGGGDRQLSNLEKDAWIILSQTDEDKNIGFPERDHLSNYLEDTAAASGTLAQSQTHIRKTEGSLTEPGNSSTALTWVPKSEELESSHCEDDASDTLARDGLWEDIDASVLERNMQESCCKQDVDESGPKEDLEESGSKQNIEQRIPRKDLDGSELTEKRLKEDLNESGPKQNTEQHGPNYDVRESNTKQDTENSDLKPSVEQSIPKQDIEQTSPKQSTEESYPKEHDEKQRHKTNMDENVPSQGDHLSDFEVASNPDSIETVPLDVDSGEQEYIFNLSDDSDIFECEPEGGAGGEDQITKEVVVGTPLRGSKTEGDVEVTCLPNRKRKLSSSGQDSPAPSCSSYNSSFDSDQEMKKLFLMLEEGINQTYQVNLQTFMQVPEVHPDYEAKHAEFLKSYKKQHEGKEHDEEHHERSWGEFWEDTVGKQLHEDWEKSKKELVEQFRVIESNSKNSSSSNSTREDQPKQMKRDESDKENQKFQSYSSNPQPLLSVCHKKSESSPLSVNRSPKTNPKHSSDFESCETDMMQFKQLLSEINPGTMSSELKWQALQLDMDKVMTSDTKKRVHLILSSFALLSELGRSLDSLAPAVVPIIKAVLDKEVDSEEALNILAKKDNVEVLKKCTEKLMLLSEKARGAYKNKLLRCVKNTIELLENVTTSLKTIKVVWGLDIPSIAKATAHQDMTHVLQFIRNTLASKGVHNPSRSMLNELFLSVSSQHFNLAIQTQPPTSPDPSK
ncbi:uncharacterized protein LOC135102896 isoform X2 [Scylla paramamosain]|uniref:uncharacterized protein LOC135102896 isoform X2 n=1 Tax=Scylla paramamosain TaxID=85552 RepID=UPI0030838FED